MVDVQATPVCSDPPPVVDPILDMKSDASNIESKANCVTIDTTMTGDRKPGIYGLHKGTGNNEITVRNANIATDGKNSHGVIAKHENVGKIKMDVRDTKIVVMGDGQGDEGTAGIFGWHRGNGAVEMNIRNADITTHSRASYGVNARHDKVGKIKIDVRNTSILTKDKDAVGIFGYKSDGSGDIEIDVRNTDITTESTAEPLNRGRPIPTAAHGIWGRIRPAITGNIDIKVQGGSIKTAGSLSHGIFGQHQGDGTVGITVHNANIATEKRLADGISGRHEGDGKIKIDVRDTSILTKGPNTSGIFGDYTKGSGSIEIDVRNTDIATESAADDRRAHGIWGWIRDAATTGNIDIKVQGGSIKTAGRDSHSIFTFHRGSGNIAIGMQDGSIETSGAGSHGILGWQQKNSNTGSLTINMRSSSIKTSGTSSHAVYGLHQGSGNIVIDMQDGSIETSGAGSHGIRVYHSGSAPARRIEVSLISGSVEARGAGASGVRIGSVSAGRSVVGSAALDSAGLRQQTVIVNGRVDGGSGTDAAGIYLAGGGRVVIGSKGSVGAASGIAILATGDVLPPDPNPNNIQSVKPRLRVDVNLAGRRLAEVLGDNWIVNDGGGTTIYINGMKLHDADTGVTGLLVPNGARNVRIRAEGVNVTGRNDDGSWAITDPVAGIIADRDFSVMDMIEEYAPRAAVYEALPGFLLGLGAAAEADRIAWMGSPAWVRVAGGKGSYTPDRASVGAEFDFKRYSVEAGIDIPLSENATGSVSVRSVRGSADVTASTGGGKIEAKGFGVAFGVAAALPDAWYARGRLSLTDYTLNTASSALGRLKTDSDAQATSLGLEIGKHIELSEKTRLTPFARVSRSTLDMDAFTDSVNARIFRVDRSRSTGGLGITAETVRATGNGKLSLRSSLGVERTLSGARTSVKVSKEGLSAQSDKTRPMLGLGGAYLWDRFSLEAALSTTGLGTGDKQHAGSIKLGIKF